MELPIAIRCPHCDATLKIKDPALLGRAGKCPRCGERFTAQAPAEPESGTYDLEHEPSLPPLPTRRARSNAARDESNPNGEKKETSNPPAKSPLTNLPLRLIAGRGAAAVMMLVSRAGVVRRNNPRWIAGSAAALLMLVAVAGVVIWKMSGRRAPVVALSPEKQAAAAKKKANLLWNRDRLKESVQRNLLRGKPREALAASKAALEIEREVFGDDSPEIATSLERIAVSYEEAEDFDQARETLQELMTLQTKRLGSNHWQMPGLRYEMTHIDLMQKLQPPQRKELNDARRLHLKAQDLIGKGRYPEALDVAGQVAEIRKRLVGEEHRSYGGILSVMGAVYQAQADYARAEPLFRQAIKIGEITWGAQHPQYARGLTQLALMYQVQADWARAERLHLQVEEIERKAHGEQHHQYALSLINLATLYEAQADYARAEQHISQAAEIIKKSLGEQHREYALAITNQAGLYQNQGDFARAQPLFEQAKEIRKKVLGATHPEYGQGLNRLALLYQSQGNSARAEPLFREALAIQQAALGGQHPAYALSLNNLAVLYNSLGDHARAESLHRQALEIRKNALGEQHPVYAQSLSNLASVFDSRGDSAQAEPLYRQAVAIRKKGLGEQHPRYAVSLSKLGLLLLRLGITKEGQRMSAEALGIVRRLADRTAGIQTERQQLAMVRQEVSSIRNEFISAVRLGDLPPENVYTELLPLKGLVSARQQELRVVQQQAAREPDSPAAQAFAQLMAQTQLLAQLAQMTPEPQQAAAHQKRMREAHDKLEEIQQKLAKVSAPFRQAKSQRARTPAELAAVLPQRAALVDLIVFGQYLSPDAEHKRSRWEDQIAAFIVRPDRPVASIFLGPAESIGKAVDDWRKSYGVGESASAGTRLRQQLWEPLEPSLEGIDTVLISPDGPLCGLPWCALPGKSSDSYLIEKYAFAVVPIPQLLPQLLAPPPKAAEPTLLLVGDIDYGGEPGQSPAEASARAAVGRERDGRRMTFARLKAGPSEIASIGDTFRARFPQNSATVLKLGNTGATEAAFRRISPAYRWLHIVTHGYFAQGLSSASPTLGSPDDFSTSADRPVRIEELAPDLLSGIALTGANRPVRERADDGIMTALEVSTLDLHQTEMVVLSACETGLGRAAGGEGLLGLQRAFQLAGTRTVVATLWQVDDKATELLMRDFYENLWKSKLPKLRALRQAQLSMLHWGAQRLKAKEKGQRGLDLDTAQAAPEDGRLPPYFWAAFVLSGDWR